MFAPHLAVEMLHAPFAPTGGPARKAFPAAQEMGVGVPVQGHPGLGRAGLDGLLQPPLTGLAHLQGLRPQLPQPGSQALLEPMPALGQVSGVVHFHMAHRPSACTQPGTEVPHGRQKQGDAGLVTPDGIGLTRGLDQQDAVERGVESVQRRVAHPQLITQDQHQPTHRR